MYVLRDLQCGKYQVKLILCFLLYILAKKRLHSVHIYSKIAMQNADLWKKHENLLLSNYKNKHIPLCFYIFRSLLTPFIRYLLHVCYHSFSTNRFFCGLWITCELSRMIVWYYIFHSEPKVVNFVWSRKITDLLEKFPSI